ncbi:MAG: hypothetical protein ISS77_07155 [Phycisphaerae bacterium]|nr:hypothetical protein [Phycisphaerae bacterium]
MQPKIEQHKPLVILPDSYFPDLTYDSTKWKLYFILAISILAFATSYLVYETPYPLVGYYNVEGESETPLLALLKGLLPLYLFYIFYTLGKASIVSFSKQRLNFWIVSCLCLTSHNIGWLVLFKTLQPDNRLFWIGLITGLILLFFAVCLFLIGCTLYKKLTQHEKISFAEYEKKLKADCE